MFRVTNAPDGSAKRESDGTAMTSDPVTSERTADLANATAARPNPALIPRCP